MKNGVIHTIATALIAYAVIEFNDNFWQALLAGAVGVGFYLGKEYLVQRGWNISGK